jgi:lipid kinase YegS
MRKLRLVLHGKGAAEPILREAVAALRERGHDVDVRATWEAGHAEHFAREAATTHDVVVAGGGDGTINEVVRGLLSADEPPRAALGILPLGTANDLARGLGLPLDDRLAALVVAAEGPLVPLDVGVVNDQPFVNVASGGFAAEITSRTPPELKDALGGLAYSITGLFTAPQLVPHACRFIAEGQSFEMAITILAIGNGRLAGGGYAVTPEARTDDGLLDLVLVPSVPLGELPQLIGELFQASAAENEYVLYRQLKQFELHFADEFQLNLDGEPLRGRDFRVAIRPQALQLAGAPVLGTGPQLSAGL